jgi:succinyl-diaminopimelate desuccinylase
MKGSLAAMITAAERFCASHELEGRLGFLITSDEEGQAINGTRKVVETFQQRGLHIDYCVVGEPSSTEQLGDTVKIGRRGSLSCKLVVKGIKGHVAYPHLALNPIHEALPVLAEIAALTWDGGNSAFPPSTFQISNIHGGVGANNVIPETLEVDFNLRYSTEISADEIKARIEELLQKSGIRYECQWYLSGEPFLTSTGRLIDVVSQCTEEITGLKPQLSTAGGTSDGRFIAPTGTEVVELGPCNATIHKIDECVRIEDLEQLSRIYEAIMGRLSRNQD